MSTYSCTCTDGTFRSDATSCEGCSSWCNTASSCTTQPNCMQTCYLNASKTTTAAIAGVSIGIFFALLAVTVIFWVFLVWFSVHVLKKCKGKPGWLNGTVIALLVLLFLMGWVPGLGFLLLVGLLVLLIIYNNKCKKVKST